MTDVREKSRETNKNQIAIEMPVLIKELELEYQRISEMIKYVDDRSNGVVYASGALSAFIISFLIFVVDKLELPRISYVIGFESALIMSLLLGLASLMISIRCMYPMTYKTKSKGFEFLQSGDVNVSFKNVRDFWVKMNENTLFDYRVSLLSGQLTIVLKKLQYLKYALKILFISVLFLIISFLFLIFARACLINSKYL